MKKIKNRGLLVWMFCIAVLLGVSFPTQKVKAEVLPASAFGLSATEAQMYVDQSMELSLVPLQPGVSLDSVELDWDVSDSYTLDLKELQKGKWKISGEESGTVQMNVTVTGTDENQQEYEVGTYTCKITVKERKVSLNYTQLKLYPEQGGTFRTTVEPADQVKSITYVDEVSSKKKFVNKTSGVFKAEKYSWSSGTVTVNVKFKDTDQVYSAQCEVTIQEASISALCCAKGAKQSLSYYEPYGNKITWTSADTKIATVSSKGVVKGKKAGKVKIKASVKGQRGTYRFSKTIRITDPKFEKSTYQITAWSTLLPKVKGMATYSTYTPWKLSSKKYAKLVNHYVYPYKNGSFSISTTVDGKKIKCKVKVAASKAVTRVVALTKGESQTIQVKGRKISFYSANSKVATVSSSGKVRAKALGSTLIYITTSQGRYSIVATVGKKAAIQAVRTGYGVLGAKYSQDKRMSAGYYDCSSFAWRSYCAWGVNMGYSSYAPTAAGIGEYYAKKKQVVAKKAVSTSKLRAGDLILYHLQSTKNGRYLSIDHVAMYVGAGKYIHSGVRGVSEGYYSVGDKHVKLIVRPVK